MLATAFVIALLAQAEGPRGDSTYATPALRAMVSAAAESNRHPPRELRGYTSRVETEVGLIIRDSLGRENAGEIEQMTSRARWTRDGPYDLHVVGYRAQTVGVPYSSLTIVRGWTVPSLYGERLSLGAYMTRANRRDTLTVVHPFAEDRDQYYRFTGGDTVTTLRVGNRSVPIARIRVHPDFHHETRFGAFDGEIDLDATRFEIVRMRGKMVVLGGHETFGARFARAAGVVAAAYVEFVNAEYNGRYWLPSFQRTEFQASFPGLGQSRPVFRIVSTIADLVADTGATVADTSKHPLVVVTWAPSDSVDSFSDWRTPIGTETSSVRADDFADLAPTVWRADGPPQLLLFSGSLGHVFRFNRVEGLYVGIAPNLELRSAAPGLSVGAYGGWAFTEQTARGGAFASWKHGAQTFGVRAERTLASTNDFGIPLGDDPGFGALLSSVDDDDYLDRRRAAASVTRIIGAIDVALITAQAGFGQDRPERTRLSQGIFSTNGGFRLNRGATAGDYVFGSVDAEFHPSVTGDFARPGIGARAHYEYGRGDLDWQRAELGLSARQYVGPLSLGAHADFGAVFGADPPPQQLFELGGNMLLPGYRYKQFAGDRAALFRTFVGYRFGVLQRPILLVRRVFIPGLSPGLVASIQGGWTEISSSTAANSVRQLGVDANGDPLSVATNGIRATAGAGISFFSDLLHVGLARPIDHPAHWRLVVGFGTLF
ncbi:MAG TPA: hypothetical protein VGQ44_03165 [Gemmatimonadaceae bacterium]|nr:hypothetical protein [Gemmatimonadaceae bacterium]